jgi:DNA-directed RNA polymerase
MYTLEQQIEVEKLYKTLAEDKEFNFLTKAKQNDEYADTKIGKGIIKIVLDNYMSNIEKNVLETVINKKKGIQPSYSKILKNYIVYYKNNLNDFYMTLAVQTLKVVINSVVVQQFLLSNISKKISDELHDEVELHAFMSTVENADKRYSKEMNKRVGRHFKKQFIFHAYQGNDFKFAEYPLKDMVSLGMHLIELLVETTDYFYIDNKQSVEKKIAELRPTEIFLQALQNSEDNSLARVVKYVPTIIQPKSWNGMFEGGYYSYNSVFMRYHPYIHNTKTLKRYLARLNELDLAPIYNAVNRIQNTAYHINSYMLDVVGSILESGGNRAGIPQMKPYEKLPAFPYEDK